MASLIKPTNELPARSTQSLRDYPEFDNHEFVIAISDQQSGLNGYIAVHSRKLGIAHGGTRMKAYDSDDEALRDALDLSRAMSYKSASVGLPYGGAKGVIRWDGIGDKRAILAAYAQKIEALQGLFHTGTDVGLSDEDVKYMAEFTQYMLGNSESDKKGLSTSKTAALGVFKAIKAAVQFKYGSDNLEGIVIGVKGVGKLGGELAHMLAAENAKLILSDTDESKVQAFQQKYPGTTIVPTEEMHKQSMQIFAPCALGHEFTMDNIDELSCEIIAGGANNQLESKEVGDELFKKGILYVPDYVINVGGLIFVSEDLEADGFHVERVEARLERVPEELRIIFETSVRDNQPTHRVADAIAEEKIRKGTA